MKNPKVLLFSDITGIGPEYHVGDEAMAEVSIQRFEKLIGKDNIAVACSSTKDVFKTYGVKAETFYHTTNEEFFGMAYKKPLSFIKSFLVNLRLVLTYDKIIICGGGNTTSIWKGIFESRMRFLKLANIFRREVYVVSQTLGPFNEKDRGIFNKTLKQAKWLGVRDKQFSHKQTNLETHFTIDDACFLEPADIPSEFIPDRLFATVSMRKFGDMNDDNVNEIGAEIQKSIAKHNLSTVFIPHHSPGGTEGDTKLAQTIKPTWGDAEFNIIDPIRLASELKTLTGKSEVVISMRYHQIIFALSMGIPCVAIHVNEYTEAKLCGAFMTFGLEPIACDYRNVSNELDALVEKALSSKDAFKAHAKQTLDEYETSSMHPYLMLAEKLDASPKNIERYS